MLSSIIIPSRRKSSDTIVSIARNTSNFEYITVTDDLGFAAKLNKGIEAAQGDYLIFLHDDCEVTPGWLDFLPQHGVGAFCLGENNNSLDIWGGFIDPPRYCINPRENPDYSYWLCISRKAMKEIGFFDESFTEPMYQDVQMGLQIKEAGFQIECLPGKIIHHNGEGSGVSNERQRAYLERKYGVCL